MNIIDIVDRLDSIGLIRKSKVVNRWYSIYCPFHNDGNERKPSAGILIEEEFRNGQRYPQGFFHCFTCNSAMSLVDMVTKILKQKNIGKDTLEYLRENVPGFDVESDDFEYLVPSSMIDTLNEKYAFAYLQSLLNKKQPEYVTEEELSKYRYTVPYMYQRGLTDELIDKYDIGVDLNYQPYENGKVVPCITFPVRDSFGNCLFVARRSIEGKSFYLPREIDKPLYGVYELPNNCKSLDVVESCFNALTCVKYGRPAIALFGTGTPSQMTQLRRLGVREVRVGTDPDEAGDKAYKRIKKSLQDVSIVWRYQIPEGKDINDLSYEEFKSLELL